jgi:hypothetical protein
VVEHARLGQLAQLGVDEAAAQHRDDVGKLGLDGLGDAKCRIHRAGKGTDSSTVGWWRRAASRVSSARVSSTRSGGGQGLGQRVEVGWLPASDSA